MKLVEILNQKITKMINRCLSAFEDACDYLTERGYLQTLNGRIYTIKQGKLKSIDIYQKENKEK